MHMVFDIKPPTQKRVSLCDADPVSPIIQAHSIEPFQSIMVQSATISRRSMTRSDVGVAQQNRARPASLSSSGNAITVDLP